MASSSALASSEAFFWPSSSAFFPAVMAWRVFKSSITRWSYSMISFTTSRRPRRSEKLLARNRTDQYSTFPCSSIARTRLQKSSYWAASLASASASSAAVWTIRSS